MSKFWKQTMALFLVFALVFGTLVPVVAWAEESVSVDAPAEEQMQAEPKEQLPAEETEGKETEENEALELSEENTPVAQGAPTLDKPFTVTKRPMDNPGATEETVGEYDTFHAAIGACKQEDLGNLYIVTMNRDYTISGEEGLWGKSSVNILLQSAMGHQYKLTRQLKDEPRRNFLDLYKDCHLIVKNVILDGDNVTQFTFLTENAQLTLSTGTVVQNCVDNPHLDGPAIYLSGNAILNIEDGVVIKDNKSDQTKGYFAGVIYAAGNSTVNIKGGEFTNNRSNGKDGGVIRSGSDAVVNISGGTFKKNTAKRLGGVIQAYGTVKISGGTFEGNEASTGGVVYAKKASIQNAQFTSNKANYAGAISTTEEATIQKSVFTSNTASSAGGAFYLSGVTKIANSEFQSNSSKQGGAIYSKGELDVSDTSFTQNEANDGGAVLAIAKMTLTGDTFTSNKATKLGGAVVIADVAEITKTGFESNKAQNGGALHISDENTNVIITESTFKNNHAEHQGGAISDAVAQYANKITDQKAYRNLTTDAKTLFQGNKADGGLFNPPENYKDFTNLKFDPQSDVKHGKLTRESLLNNYDVNYDNNMRTITYDANGGKFDDGTKIKTEEYAVGANITIRNAPTRRGYTFKYWKGSEYRPGDHYKVTDNHTFVAQWEKDESTPQPPKTEQIIVDPNGGAFTDGTSGRKTYDLKVGETFLLPEAPTREGYKFIAWQGKDAEYQPGYPYIVKTGGEVFTARWEKEKKSEEKPSVTPSIKTPKGTPLMPDEIAKILAGMKKTVPAIPRAGVGK